MVTVAEEIWVRRDPMFTPMGCLARNSRIAYSFDPMDDSYFVVTSFSIPPARSSSIEPLDEGLSPALPYMAPSHCMGGIVSLLGAGLLHSRGDGIGG